MPLTMHKRMGMAILQNFLFIKTGGGMDLSCKVLFANSESSLFLSNLHIYHQQCVGHKKLNLIFVLLVGK